MCIRQPLFLSQPILPPRVRAFTKATHARKRIEGCRMYKSVLGDRGGDWPYTRAPVAYTAVPSLGCGSNLKIPSLFQQKLHFHAYGMEHGGASRILGTCATRRGVFFCRSLSGGAPTSLLPPKLCGKSNHLVLALMLTLEDVLPVIVPVNFLYITFWSGQNQPTSDSQYGRIPALVFL